MNNLIKGNEKGIYEFTKHSVERLQQTEGFNKNHLAKVLVGHIETMNTLIDNLLKNSNEYTNENKTK